MDQNQFNQWLFGVANRSTAAFMHTVFEKQRLLSVDDATKERIRKAAGDGFHAMRRHVLTEMRKCNEETDGSGTVQPEDTR